MICSGVLYGISFTHIENILPNFFSKLSKMQDILFSNHKYEHKYEVKYHTPREKFESELDSNPGLHRLRLALYQLS